LKIAFYGFANSIFFFKELSKYFKNNKVETKIILPRGTHLNKIDKKEIFYLYENFNTIYNQIQKIDFNLQKDNIYKILECDKNETDNQGYKSLDKEKQLKLVYTIYKIYKDFLLEYKPTYLIFPDVESVDGNILLNLCYELNIKVIYFVHLRQLGKSFFSDSIYEILPPYFGDYNQQNLAEAKNLVENFFSISSRNFIKEYSDTDRIKIYHNKLYKRILTSIYLNFTKEKYFFGEGKSFLYRIRVNLIYFVEKYRKFKFNLQQKYFDIKTDNDKLPENFILFAMQVTPESSINSLEPYFIDQIRAIDLIRLNMPNNFYILVKEHPSMRGLRNNSFYKNLRKKAGVILVAPQVNTKKLMKKAKLISTISGTIGLESFMMDKPALLFGPTFFSHLVYRYNSFLNFREFLKEIIFTYKPMDKNQKIIEIAKLYNISYSIMLFDPFANPEVMEKGNIENYYKAILEHIKRVEVSK